MNTPILRPDEPTPEAVAHARRRVFAADVRDRKAPYESAPAKAVAWAVALCRALDTLDGLRQARRDPQGLDATVEMLLARLAEYGLRPPE